MIDLIVCLRKTLFIFISCTLAACGGNSSSEGPDPMVDTTPPIISLNGNSSITLAFGESYAELGATAIDDVDGNVEVVISGIVEPSISGEYVITYSATDSSGNQSEKKRTVLVLEQRAFITTWDTRMYGVSADDQIKIDTQGNGFDYSVDWGDGSKDHHVTGDVTHTYSAPGIYTIKITGNFPHFIMNESDEEQSSQVDENGNPIVVFVPNSDVKKLLSIEQWGDIVWASMHASFRGTELAITATDTPDLSNVTDMSYMFASSRIYGNVNDDWDSPTPVDLSQWNTGNVTNMSHLFFNAGISTYHTAFDYDITVVSGYESWDVSSVIDMSFMFSGVVYLSANFDSWDVSQVTNMSGLFNNLYRFELALSEWDVSNVIDMSYMFSFETTGDPFFFSEPKLISSLENWDVSSVTNMNSMFKTKNVQEQNLSNWDVSKVTDMSSMFAYTDFDDDLSSWDVSRVLHMNEMFQEVSLSNENYDALLLSWSNQNVQSSVRFDGGNSKYSVNSAAARLHLIEHFNWIITDAGEVEEN